MAKRCFAAKNKKKNQVKKAADVRLIVHVSGLDGADTIQLPLKKTLVVFAETPTRVYQDFLINDVIDAKYGISRQGPVEQGIR